MVVVLERICAGGGHRVPGHQSGQQAAKSGAAPASASPPSHPSVSIQCNMLSYKHQNTIPIILPIFPLARPQEDPGSGQSLLLPEDFSLLIYVLP